VALVGLEGRIVEVEADIGAGLPCTVLVGLPDSALYQSRGRCKSLAALAPPTPADEKLVVDRRAW
jgi:predicted ATPase with chaperone activity